MLKQRMTTASCIAAAAIGAIFLLPSLLFALITGLVVIIGSWEWANIAGWSHKWLRTLYSAITILLMTTIYFLAHQEILIGIGFMWWVTAIILIAHYPDSKIIWKHRCTKLIIGWLILLPAWISINYIYTQPQGYLWTLYLLGVTSTADMVAYFVGKQFGSHRLAPTISPKKSWQGAISAIIVTSMVTWVVSWMLHFSLLQQALLIIISLATASMSIIGDLLESMFKRERNIKDSGSVLPGHGGVLDRIDSLTASSLAFTIVWILMHPLL